MLLLSMTFWRERKAKRDVHIRLPFSCSHSIFIFELQVKLIIGMLSIFILEGLFLLSLVVATQEKCVK